MGASYSRQLLALPALSTSQTAAGWSHLCTHLTNAAYFDEAQVACNKAWPSRRRLMRLISTAAT